MGTPAAVETDLFQHMTLAHMVYINFRPENGLFFLTVWIMGPISRRPCHRASHISGALLGSLGPHARDNAPGTPGRKE